MQAWAQHRGNETDPLDHKKLKGNFRCALTKSDDFEEMKNYSKTNQQMGNYKVFQLLSPREVTGNEGFLCAIKVLLLIKVLMCPYLLAWLQLYL